MSVTTIKVDSAVRDRLAALARERSMTQGSLVEMLLEEFIWAERMARVKEQMANASEEDMRTYREETAAWIALSSDALLRRVADWDEPIDPVVESA